jgi:PKD repeat protein
VTLVVDNGSGARSESVKTISVNPRPAVAAFTYTPQANITTATNVQFRFQQAPNTGTPDSYLWTFGDAGTSTERDPTFRFPRSGPFDVTLEVQNAGNAGPSSTTQRIRVTVQPPAPAFSIAPAPRMVGTNLAITNTTPSVPGTTFLWTWDDGSTSTGATPTKAYTRTGTFDVTLRATVDGVSLTSAPQRITISPAINAAFTVPATVDSGQLVAIANTTTGASAYSWDWGDGTPGGTGPQPEKRYTNLTNGPVTRTIRMTASNPGGAAPEVTRTITVRAALPVADFVMTGAPDGSVTVTYRQTPTAGARRCP